MIGGGDGGCLREIARHSCVKEIVICELDEMVIEVSKKYLPGLAVGFSDPRVNVRCCCCLFSNIVCLKFTTTIRLILWMVLNVKQEREKKK